VRPEPIVEALLETAPDEDDNRCQMSEGLIVLELSLMSHQEAPEVAQPSEKSLDFPTSPVTAQLPTVLRADFAVTPVRNNHVHAIFSQRSV
jgi:hypothetical protein